MKIDIFTLCDFASVYGGKICIMGVSEVVLANQFPANISSVLIAVKLRAETGDEGDRLIKTSITDQDGGTLVSGAERIFKVSGFKNEPNSVEIRAHFYADQYQNFQIPLPGEYSVQLLIDGNHAASIPIYFLPSPQRQKPV